MSGDVLSYAVLALVTFTAMMNVLAAWFLHRSVKRRDGEIPLSKRWLPWA